MTVTPNNLIDQLRRDEGEVLHVYLDTRGIRTAGVGHNLEAHGIDLPVDAVITQQQSDTWLEQDSEKACDLVHIALPWSDNLDDTRRAVLQNMCFNLGINKLLLFHHMLAFARSGDYQSSAREMLNSTWATEVGDRAKRLSVQMETATWQ